MIVLNVITYITAGGGVVVSLPLLIIVYLACGALAAKLNADENGAQSPTAAGAMSGLILAGAALIVNLVLTLILGAVTVGIGLLASIPSLCLCGPVQVVGGALLAAIGGFLYGMFAGGGKSSDYNW